MARTACRPASSRCRAGNHRHAGARPAGARPAGARPAGARPAGARPAGIRRLAGIAAAAAVAATAALMVPATAHAAVGEYADSPYDTAETKSVTATCAAGRVVLGTGGMITGGRGSVGLTALVPDGTLQSVTATGQALPGYGRPWSVTVVAICGYADSSMPKLVSSGPRPGSASVTCPAGTVVVGTGFRVPGTVDQSRLVGVVPAADLSGVSVTAVQPAPVRLGGVVAYAICAAQWAELATASSGPPDPATPKVVTVAGTGFPVTGLGAAVSGDVKEVLIDGMVPEPGLYSLLVRARRYAPVAPVASSAPSGPIAGLAAPAAGGDPQGGAPEGGAPQGGEPQDGDPGDEDAWTLTGYGVNAPYYY